ncbi:MAG: hypothetical protein KDD42_06800, partial [Bdellovibrionales bacterium]|nr:hypothetical protein [Bdellovibrionales bacterium]
MSAGKALLEKDPAAVPNLGNERGPEINRRREKERDQEVRREDLRLEAQTVGDATGIGDGRYAGRMANQRTVDQNVANQNEEARRSQAWRSTRKRKREFERGRDEKENARLAALLDLGEEQEVPELDDPMEIAPSNSDHSVENYLEELLAQNLEEGLDLHIRNGSGSSSELPTSQSESPEFQEDSGAGSQTRVARSDSRDQVADVQGPKSMAAPITVFSTNRNGVFAPQEFLLKKYEGALGFFSKARDETGVFFKGCGRLLKFATSPAMRAQYKTLVGIGWEALKEWAQGVDWGDLAKRGLIAGIKLQNWVMKAPF